jgi:catechol 2,3-dioxygenase-like lactoylglutathione lyase family enzyme
MQLFHYHLVTSKVRQVEARYLGKLGFELVARHGRIGEQRTAFEAGRSWDELDRVGFKLRLSELQRGAVNVVVQPGQWELPRVDHLGFALDDETYDRTLVCADQLGLRIQDNPGRRTFIATRAGYRLEVHPEREWLEDVLEAREELRIGELRLRADDPREKAEALAELLGAPVLDGDGGSSVPIGDAVISFLPGGPKGRPELNGELFL